MATHAVESGLNTGLFIILLVVGVVALALGVNASDSIGSDFSRLFTGQPTDKALWLLIGGGVSTLAGLIGLARGRR
ncbi:MAG: DUF3185 family protein [Planctomycetes bacterium]|nr:DUF3185 family protein [Planctomycetota bacterium]